MKGVILAAGKGTRMQGLCEELPKPLLPIANRPILAHSLAHLEAAGIREALVVVGHQARLIQQAVGRRCGRVDVRYAVQEEPRGTGQATALAEEFVAGEPFVMVFGDIVTSARHLPALARTHIEERPAATLAVRYVPNAASGGAVYVDDGLVARIVERPEPGQTTTHFINAGIFVFPPRIFELLRHVEPSARGEYELTDAIAELVDSGRAVRACKLDGFWVNVTDPTSYLEAHSEVLAELDPRRPEAASDVVVEGRVVVDGECRLAPCRLGPNVSVGQACTIGAGASVRDAVVMAGATIGAGATVDTAIVGLGARVRDGARLMGEPDQEAEAVGHGQVF